MIHVCWQTVNAHGTAFLRHHSRLTPVTLILSKHRSSYHFYRVTTSHLSRYIDPTEIYFPDIQSQPYSFSLQSLKWHKVAVVSNVCVRLSPSTHTGSVTNNTAREREREKERRLYLRFNTVILKM